MPAFPLELTRIETDPRYDAEAIAEAVREVLERGKTRDTRTIVPRFVPGSTTCPLAAAGVS